VLGWVLLRTAYFNPSRSIAVLPFEDDSKDVSIQYISEGITEGVINNGDPRFSALLKRMGLPD